MKKLIISMAAICLAALAMTVMLSSCKKDVRSLDAVMRKFEEKGQKRKSDLYSPFSGVVLVAKNNKVIFKEAYGYADRTDMIENDVNDIYPIASLTKQFTALLTLMLSDGGHLNLDDRVSKLLPAMSGTFADSITIHQLLSHTSGLPHYEGLEAEGTDREDLFNTEITPSQYVELIGEVDLLSAPGTEFYYTSLGYVLLGAVMEAATGKTYAELLDSLIVQPLGLENTGFAGNDFIADETVQGYYFSRNGGLEIAFSKYHGVFHESDFRDQSTLFSTGGMHSTLDDLFKWSKAVGEFASLYDAYLEPNLRGYCYGWVRNEDDLIMRNNFAKHYTHTGDLNGHSASITLYDDGTTIIHLANVQPLNDNELIHQLYLAAHQLKDDQFLNQLPKTGNMAAFLVGGGLTVYNSYYRDLSEACGYQISPSPHELNDIMFLFYEDGRKEIGDSLKNILMENPEASEGMFNNTGYRLLGRHDCITALDFFEANAARHPESANVWDSQGDGYVACEQYDNAIESFREAIRIGELTGDGNLDLYKRNLKDAEKAKLEATKLGVPL